MRIGTSTQHVLKFGGNTQDNRVEAERHESCFKLRSVCEECTLTEIEQEVKTITTFRREIEIEIKKKREEGEEGRQGRERESGMGKGEWRETGRRRARGHKRRMR